MVENYYLAKKIVNEKYDKNDEFYYMYICALFGLFMKFPDNKDLIIKAFMDTDIIIENASVLEIQQAYGLNLIKQDELDVEDQDVCVNFGVSDSGFCLGIADGKINIIKDQSKLVCSASDCDSTTLLNVFIHELCHIIKCINNGYGGNYDGGKSSCYIRCGLSFTLYTYDKDTDICTNKTYYAILDEVINVFQTTDILGFISMLDGVTPDCDLQKYLNTLDRDAMKTITGYEKCCKPFKKIWDNAHLKKILEEHLIDGNLEEIANDFDNITGINCFDNLADLLDEVDYLFCLNNNRKLLEKKCRKLEKLISTIISYKTKVKE